MSSRSVPCGGFGWNGTRSTETGELIEEEKMVDKTWVEDNTPASYQRFARGAGYSDDVAENIWKDAAGYRNYVAWVLISQIGHVGDIVTGGDGRIVRLSETFSKICNRDLFNQEREELPDR